MFGLNLSGLGSAALSPSKGGFSLTRAIARWNAAQSDARVNYGGRQVLTTTSSFSGGATGRTFVCEYVIEGIRQDGFIRLIEANVSTVGPASGWKFKLFRPNGADFDMVAETEFFTPAGTGNRSFVPANPLGPCQPGDRLGVWLAIGSAAGMVTVTGATIRWSAGDLSQILSSGSSITNNAMCIRASGVPPFIVCTGDSIFEGHNGATDHHTFYHLGPSGPPAAEPYNQVRALEPTLSYQNYAQGGSTWAMTAAKAAAISLVTPNSVHVLCGVNDVIAGSTFEAIEPSMDSFRAGLPVGAKVFVNEILPWNGGNDVQAAMIRDYNDKYAIWCAENNATLVTCHDQMGAIRGSTGELDNLISGYGFGTIHLSVPIGVDALASIMHGQLLTANYP